MQYSAPLHLHWSGRARVGRFRLESETIRVSRDDSGEEVELQEVELQEVELFTVTVGAQTRTPERA